MTEKHAHVGGIRPEPIILSRNAELVSRALRVPVCHSGKHGHARDPASGGFLHWFHRIKHDGYARCYRQEFARAASVFML
jgi:hypothetical protein